MATSSDHLAASIDPFLHYSFSDYLCPALDYKSILSNDDFNLLLQPQPVQEDHLQYQNLNLNQSLSPFSSSELQQQQFQHKQTTTTTTNPTQTPSASDPETSTTPKRRTTTTSLNSKPRITKRKSRAKKKNQTTFFTADPANFRQMVQQVTGIRFDNNSSPFPSSLTNLLRPETRRPVGRLYNASLPTLDTSSFLVDQSQSLIGDRLEYGVGGGLGSVGVGAKTVNCESGGYGGGASDGFVKFPTLESWKVM